MEDKMESEQSFSGESSSSSETSSDSSDGDEEAMEPVRILGHTMELPQELCEDYSVFKEFFSMKTWEALDEEQQKHLKTYLPKFDENEEEETEKTIKMLFNHEPFHFTSPLSNFHSHLRQGNYRPDIAKMRKFLMKARAKQQRHKVKSYYARLLPEVLLSRERLIAAASAAPPGPVPRLPLLPPKPSAKNKRKPLFLRAKQRYFEELAAMYSEVGADGSDDENYPDGPPEQSARKRKHMTIGPNFDGGVLGTLGLSDAHPTSIACLKKILASHRSRRQYRETHPELNITGITLDDIKQRVALVNGTKKLMFGGQKTEGPTQKLKRGPKKDSGKGKSLEQKNIVKKSKEEQSDNLDNKPLLANIKIKCEQVESDSESSSFVDPVASPKHTKKLLELADIKQEVVDLKYPSVPNVNYSESKLENIIKQEPPDPTIAIQNASKLVQPVPIKLEDLDGIDMMALPVELADDSGEVIPVDTSGEPSDEQLVDADESLTETTHASFLSLVRALFPARAAHRASKLQLHSRCAAVMKSPIAPLNTWYHSSDDWCSELDSALDFLAGERGPHPDDFVPYLQFLPETQMYQWIGAGRDCDAILGRLCERWLRAVSPGPPTSEPPPPRYPTSWVMRAPTTTEITEFRVQERKRFAAAAKPFTYVQHGYRSVVGPVARAGVAAGAAGALLAAERPRHAAFVALVRDAVARLPNGEGTRHDVLTLLKMSQWIGTCNDQALLGALSSALDRLHSAKRDPVVKYDQRTAVWTYLHRNRTEDDWVKTSGRGRGGKTAAAAAAASAAAAAAAASAAPAPAPPAPAAPAEPPPPPPPPPPPRAKEPSLPPPQPAMELEVGSVEEIVENASDSDVDVEDTSINIPTSTQLSSAQLLMQATQTAQPKLPPTKAKGKLVPAQPAKPKPTVQVKQPAKPTLMTQSVKQANLLSQAAKQATLMSQAVKQANLLQSAKAHLVKPPVQAKPVTKQVPILQTKQTVQPQKPPTPVQKPAVLTQKPIVPPIKTTVTPQKPTVVPQKQTTQAKQTTPKQATVVQRQVTVAKPAQSPKQMSVVQTKPVIQGVKQVAKSNVITTSQASPANKTLPTVVAPPHKSPLIKQRPLQRETTQQLTTVSPAPPSPVVTVVQPTVSLVTQQNQNKLVQGTRSLLLRPPAAAAAATAAAEPAAQAVVASRRGVVRVLSPATPSSGRSLISPRALMQQGATASAAVKKRISVPSPTPVSTVVQTPASLTTVVSSTPTIVTPSATRTVQLAGGRTVQLAANQTVHLPGGQAVQLSSGHTLQLSSLQLPTHSVRLPSGQTVQLASPQTMQAVRAVSSASLKNPSSRVVQAPIIKNVQTSQSTVIPVSTVQLSGQTVQIGGQTVQLAGQSVQLTGHTVKLPSGQSVQLASQGVMPTQSLQLPSGQTVQLSGNVQTMLAGQSVQMPSGQSVQLGSQMVQIAGQAVQLGGQTVQLSSGQTIQLSSGQTLQLASGQTVQLANQQAPKTITQVVRSQATGDKPAQPIVAKLLTNAQGQMISLEGVVGVGGAGGARALPGAGAAGRARGAVRVLKHNIILQQGDGNTIRVTSASTGPTASQTIVLSNLGAQAGTTTTTSTPVLKLQQVNPILQQVKLAQGIKIQQASPATATATVPTSSGVRSVLMDGQQLKLVGGRHVLARILRPAQPPP